MTSIKDHNSLRKCKKIGNYPNLDLVHVNVYTNLVNFFLIKRKQILILIKCCNSVRNLRKITERCIKT